MAQFWTRKYKQRKLSGPHFRLLHLIWRRKTFPRPQIYSLAWGRENKLRTTTYLSLLLNLKSKWRGHGNGSEKTIECIELGPSSTCVRSSFLFRRPTFKMFRSVSVENFFREPIFAATSRFLLLHLEPLPRFFHKVFPLDQPSLQLSHVFEKSISEFFYLIVF